MRLTALVPRGTVLVTWVVLALVVAAVPLAIRSMATTLLGEQEAILYDLTTGVEVPPVVASRPDPNQTYVNIAIVNLDPRTGEMTLAVSATGIARPRALPSVSPSMPWMTTRPSAAGCLPGPRSRSRRRNASSARP